MLRMNLCWLFQNRFIVIRLAFWICKRHQTILINTCVCFIIQCSYLFGNTFISISKLNNVLANQLLVHILQVVYKCLRLARSLSCSFLRSWGRMIICTHRKTRRSHILVFNDTPLISVQPFWWRAWHET